MLKCLSALPKAQSFRSIQFRFQSPGTASHFKAGPNILDPSHPGAKLKRFDFPNYRSSSLDIQTLPVGLRRELEYGAGTSQGPSFETWTDRVSRSFQEQATTDAPPRLLPAALPHETRGRIPMSCLVILTKKATSKQAVIRQTVNRKLRTALNLIAIRGAHKLDGKLALDPAMAEEAQGWFLRGWTYIFHPKLEIYRLPYHDLVDSLRTAFKSLHGRAMVLEDQWFQREMTRHKLKTDKGSRDNKKTSPSLLNKQERTDGEMGEEPLLDDDITVLDVFSRPLEDETPRRSRVRSSAMEQSTSLSDLLGESMDDPFANSIDTHRAQKWTKPLGAKPVLFKAKPVIRSPPPSRRGGSHRYKPL